MLEANEMKVLRKIVGKTKIDRRRSQEIRESYGTRPINEWLERRRRRECDHYTIYLSEEDLQDALNLLSMEPWAAGKKKTFS